MSAPVPPISVLTLLTVPVLARWPGSAVGAGAEIDLHGGGQRGAQRDGVVAGAAGDGLGVRDGGGVGEVAEGQRVAAGAEVDAGVAGGGAQGDGVGAGAADQCVDVLDRAGVGDVGQGQLLLPAPRSTDMPVVSALPRVMLSVPVPPVMVSVLATVAVLAKLPRVRRVAAGAEVDAGVGDRGARVTVSLPVPPMMVSTLATVAVLVPLARVSVSLPAPRLTLAVGDARCRG